MVTFRSNMPPGCILLILVIGSQSGLGSVINKQYLYFASPVTWQHAQSHCKSKGYDLATIRSESDINQVLVDGFYAWIGLELLYQGWTWADGQLNVLDNWGHDEPDHSEYKTFIYSKDRRFYGANSYHHYFFICQSVVSGIYDYKLIPQSKTWYEAQQYCRKGFGDLAVTNNFHNVNASVKQRDFPVWVGLRRDEQQWSWTLGSSRYNRWAKGQPDNVNDCASIFALSKELATYDCSDTYLPFLCMRENVVLVSESKTWEEARNYCQAHGDQLLSVQPGDDFDKVRGYVLAANTEKVWTGLRFLDGSWFWTNGATVSDSRLPQCPSMMQRCGALAKSSADQLETVDCAEKLNFLCYVSTSSVD